MALVVEDGSIVDGANTYGDATDFIAYALARGIVIAPASAEVYLTRAMDYIESQTYPGVKVSELQPLQFPRDSFYIDGYLIANDTIPQLLIDALFEAGIAESQGYGLLSTQTRLTKRYQVGPVSKEYVDGGISSAFPRALHAKLNRLLGSNSSNGFEFKVSPA